MCHAGVVDSEPQSYQYGDRSLQDKWLAAGVKNLARIKQPGRRKPSSPWHLVCQMILPIIIALEDRNSSNLVRQVGERRPNPLVHTQRNPDKKGSLDIATKTASARLRRSSGRVSPRQQASKPSLRNDVMHHK